VYVKIIASQRWDIFWDTVYKYDQNNNNWLTETISD